MSVEFTNAEAAAVFRALDEAHSLARAAGQRPPTVDVLLTEIVPGLPWGHPLARTLLDVDRALRETM